MHIFTPAEQTFIRRPFTVFNLFRDIDCTREASSSLSYTSCFMSRTWRLAVAGLLDNLKWNNSVRRAQTCVGVRASAKGVRA